MRTRTNQLRPLEGLETRFLMAGNVTAIVKNGSLIITGDAEANQILIQEFMGDLNVLGVGTTVNGMANQTFPGIYRDVRISLLAGDDTVDLAPDAIISRDLVFKGGPGINIFNGELGSGIGRDLVLQGGAGSMIADLDGMQIGRDARGSSLDTMYFITTGGTMINGQLRATADSAGVNLTDSEIGGLKIVAGTFSLGLLDNVRVAGHVSYRGGVGDDTFVATSPCDFEGNVIFRGRGGANGVGLEGSVAGNLNLGMGAGTPSIVQLQDLIVLGNLSISSSGNSADIWELERVSLLGNLSLSSSGGDDDITIDDAIFFGAFTIKSGGGIDEVRIAQNQDVLIHGKSVLSLGAGDDTLQLGMGGGGTVDFRAAVSLNGGLGVDVLDDQMVNFLVPATSTAF